MKLLMILALFTVFLQSFTVQACPDNCVCIADEAECTITSCSLMELETGFGSLTVHGILCPEQRKFLEKITDVTFISLKDDNCGDIPNCR